MRVQVLFARKLLQAEAKVNATKIATTSKKS
jgi:hypothetical protein